MNYQKKKKKTKMNQYFLDWDRLLIGSVLGMVIVLMAMAVDLAAGLWKAKVRGEVHTSKGYRRTVTKFIVFNNSTGDLHYSLFSDCIGKGVDIINANDKHQLYIASNTGYFRLSGGVCMRGVYIGTQNIYPSVSYLGAGWFFFGYRDMNWS